MKYKIKIKGLHCPNCALNLQNALNKINGVESAFVNFVNQSIDIECSQEVLSKVKKEINGFEEVRVIEDIDNFIIKIVNLDCPNCALELQEEISKISGVNNVEVDFINQKVIVNTSKEILTEIKNKINNFEDVKVVEDNNQIKKKIVSKELILIIVAALIFIVGIILSKLLDESLSYISLIIYIISYLIVGHPVLLSTVKNVLKGHIFDENFLMSIASIGAMCIGEASEGVMVMLLYQIGELLQSIAVSSSRKEIASVMNLQSEEATLLKDNKQTIVHPKTLNIGDIILIKNGDKVPVDSIIIDGQSDFDTKSLTGEALVKFIQEDEKILSGYINKGKVVKAKVAATYENSAVNKILELVENSSSKKANPEKFITKFAKFYTPIVCIIALIIAIVIPLIIGLTTSQWDNLFAEYIKRALILLVISCPCALIISVPLTYFGGIGASAKKGVLIKGAVYLDQLNKIDTALFDKTGTLTKGEFKITNIVGSGDVLDIAIALEKYSSHPLANPFKELDSSYEANEVKEIPGKGLTCKIDNEIVLVGNEKLLKDNNIEYQFINSIASVIYVVKNNQVLGYLEVDDVIKENTKEQLKLMKSLGIKRLIMLSGDNKNRVEHVANTLELDECYGELLPQEKLKKVEEIKENNKVLYVGDGINDAPVMIISDCAFSMGKLGSDAAIEASDIVLVSDNIKGVNDALKIAKKTSNIVMQNILFSIIMKVAFMVLGILNIIPLSIAVFADVGVMLICVLNALRTKIK